MTRRTKLALASLATFPVAAVLFWLLRGPAALQQCVNAPEYATAYQNTQQEFARIRIVAAANTSCIIGYADDHSGVLLFLMTTALAWFTLGLWRETKTLAVQARQDTERLNRAYIVVDKARLPDPEIAPTYPEWSIVLRNVGGVPATNVRLVTWAKLVLEKDFPGSTSFPLLADEEHGFGTLGPGRRINTASSFAKETIDQMVDLRAEPYRHGLLVALTVWYDDAFGSDHHTSFQLGGYLRLGGQRAEWVYIAMPTGDRDT